MGGLIQAALFLLNAVAGFFSTLFLLRFVMQAARVSFSGPIGHFVITLTNWGVRPLRRVIPGVWGLDLSSLIAAFAVQVLFHGLLLAVFASSIVLAAPELALQVLWSSLRSLTRLLVYLYIGALILQAVLSWVNPYSPIAGPVNQLTRPILSPIRRLLPPISGIDLSPLVAILVLQALLIVL